VIAALDATPLVEPHGGIARYTRELSRALACCFSGDEYWLVSDQRVSAQEAAASALKGPEPDGAASVARGGERMSAPAGTPSNLHISATARTGLARRWWLAGLRAELKRLRADVFHGTDFAVPYLRATASVVTLHDLSPWGPLPDGRGSVDSGPLHGGRGSANAVSARVRRRAPLVMRLRLATMIVTPSEAIRRAAMDRFEIAGDDIVATPLAAAACFQPQPVHPPQRPYFLVVGKRNPRKNIDTAEAACAEVRKEHDVELIVADGCGDSELARLYSNATALLFPSFCEGFGLPVLEAMQCGAPVIASRDAALMEVSGDAAVLLDAGDVRAWTDAMKAMLTNAVWREDLRRRGFARARQFSWERTAGLTREVYGEAIARFHRKT
jgi:glycosyltransferase involved in cell wall biosynthesis